MLKRTRGAQGGPKSSLCLEYRPAPALDRVKTYLNRWTRVPSWQCYASSGIQLLQEGFMSKLQLVIGVCQRICDGSGCRCFAQGPNTPQKSTLGLYTEQFSGTPFRSAPRATNRRSWLYRIRPSVTHRPFVELPETNLRSGPFNEVSATPNQLRWDPLPIPTSPCDFLDGIITMAGNGGPAGQTGCAVHIYAANQSVRVAPFFPMPMERC